MLNNLTAWAVATGKVMLKSDGTPWRPIVHIEDICRAFLAALEAPRDAVHAQAFNVVRPGENYRISELAAIVEETVPGCVIEFAGSSGPDARNYRVDAARIMDCAAGVPAEVDRARGCSTVVRSLLPVPGHARRHRGMALSPHRPDQPAARDAAADSRSAMEAVSATAAQLRKGDVVEVRARPRSSPRSTIAASSTRCRSCPRWSRCADGASRWRPAPNASATRSPVRAARVDGRHRRARGCELRRIGPRRLRRGVRLLYWKDAWLRRSMPRRRTECAGDATDEAARDSLLALVDAQRERAADDGEPVRFRCQATQAIEASTAVSAKDPRSYVRALHAPATSAVGHFVRVMARAVVMESGEAARSPVRAAVARCDGESRLAHRRSTCDPGEWVRIKSREEIEATLNDKGKNRGLWFDREMMRLLRPGVPGEPSSRPAHRRAHRRDDRVVAATASRSRVRRAPASTAWGVGSVPRAIYPYWREGWLERVESEATVGLPTARATREPTPV